MNIIIFINFQLLIKIVFSFENKNNNETNDSYQYLTSDYIRFFFKKKVIMYLFACKYNKK
jgi:hypothetical protein